jgi:hypothetical protein
VLGEIELRELMWRPLEQQQLGAVLRQCYALLSACHDCGYRRRLLIGARMANELHTVQ